MSVRPEGSSAKLGGVGAQELASLACRPLSPPLDAYARVIYFLATGVISSSITTFHTGTKKET